MASELITYKGSCHCGTVKYEALAPKELIVTDCNCSVCTNEECARRVHAQMGIYFTPFEREHVLRFARKKQDRHFIVPKENFKITSGEDVLTTYIFGTHQAKHLFCSKCGGQSFYIPRSGKDKRAIMPHCVDSPLPLNITLTPFDGKNWEEAIKRNREEK